MYIGSYQAAKPEFNTACGMFYYTEDESTVTLTGYDGYAEKVNVPSVINGKAVTEIASNTFDGETNIKQLCINDSIKTISENAIVNCSALTYVYINPYCGVKVPQFSGCSELKQLACKYNSALWKSQKSQRLLISVPKDTAYTGKKITPQIVVSSKGKKLVAKKGFCCYKFKQQKPRKS